MHNSPSNRLADTYLAALRNHFGQDPQASLLAARAIGQEVVANGLETLDLARIHERALAQLLAQDGTSAEHRDLSARAAAFFTEAITPIEETHQAAHKTNADLQQLHATLDERMHKLADANSELQHQVAEHTETEDGLRRSQRASSQLLKETRTLERHLQLMAHQIITATEAERHRMSLLLNDEITQTLLGINIRIQTLKKDLAANHAALAREIAATQRLVEDSAQILSRLIHEFSNQHER
ncbi:MAG: hypothetical protein WCK77_07150 [Verrucomicrobiota bacterium]